MPSKNKKNDVAEESSPSKVAFIFAAIILFSNAAASLVLAVNYSQMGTSIFSIIIDTVLGVMLLKFNDTARVVVLLRAVLGVIIFGVVSYFQEFYVLSAEAIIVQLVFSLSLIVLLGWRTIHWRLILGAVLGAIYLCYLIMAIYLSLIIQG